MLGQGTIRLMTTNLLHGGADPESFREVLRSRAPDVVVTQELGFECADVLAETYDHTALFPAPDFTGRGIASRIPTEFGVIPMTRRYATTARLDVHGQPWDLAGIHLLNPIDFPWWRSVGGRSSQLGSLEEWLNGATEPIVVAGDFNASPIWPAYRRVSRLLDDLALGAARRSGIRAERTWGWRPGWPRLLRIDHVFGRGVSAVGVEVVRVEGSDHHAVVVDLESRVSDSR